MYIIQQVKPWLNSTALECWIFVTNSLIVRLRRSFFFAFCVLNFVFSLVATLANLLVIRALMKASTLPGNVKKTLNCKKEENWGEAEGKRDDTVFSPLPLPFFPYFAPGLNHHHHRHHISIVSPPPPPPPPLHSRGEKLHERGLSSVSRLWSSYTQKREDFGNQFLFPF